MTCIVTTKTKPSYVLRGNVLCIFPMGGRAKLNPGMAALIHEGSFYRLENTGQGPMILMGNRSGQQDTIKIIDYEPRKDVRQKYGDGKVHIHNSGADRVVGAG